MTLGRRNYTRKVIHGLIDKRLGTKGSRRTAQGVMTYAQFRASEVVKLPVRNFDLIQDLDPTSETYGEIDWMMDYDPPGD